MFTFYVIIAIVAIISASIGYALAKVQYNNTREDHPVNKTMVLISICLFVVAFVCTVECVSALISFVSSFDNVIEALMSI